MKEMHFHQYRFLFVAALLIPFHATATCFWPNGDVAAESYVPCNGDVAAESYVPCNGTAEGACCDRGDICTTSGLCLGRPGYMYRGGCTSSEWAPFQCADHCSQVASGSFSNLYPCPSVQGVFTNVFCCEEWLLKPPDLNSTECCSRTGFDLKLAGGIGRLFEPENNPSSIESSASITTTTQLSTATASISKPPASTTEQIPHTVATPVDSVTSPKPSSNKRDLTIGVGVGLPVTITALIILGIFLLRQRRRKRNAERVRSNDQNNWVRNSNGIMTAEFIDGIPRELSATAIGPNELHCSHIHEAGNGHGSCDNLSRA